MVVLFRSDWMQRALLTALMILATTQAAPAMPPAESPLAPPSESGASAPATLLKTQEPIPIEEPPSGPSSQKQREILLKSKFEQMKRDADQLEALAKSLQEDLSKSNENVLSLKVVNKAAKIERLAKKIKDAAKGY